METNDVSAGIPNAVVTEHPRLKSIVRRQISTKMVHSQQTAESDVVVITNEEMFAGAMHIDLINIQIAFPKDKEDLKQVDLLA